MVGEIRDGETAEIAIQSALTGHLVFSTIHTNDSFGALTRLVDMGIEPFLVSSSILAVLAQRLVRVVCPSAANVTCRPPASWRGSASSPRTWRADRLPAGGQGMQDLPHDRLSWPYGDPRIDDDGRRHSRPGDEEGRRRDHPAGVHRPGMKLLRENGAERVLAGETTFEELLRVTQEDIL